MADRDESSFGRQDLLLAALSIEQLDALERSVLSGLKALDRERRRPLDVLGLARAVEHDLRGAELSAAVYDRHLRSELSEEDRLLHRRVAAANDDRLLINEEGRVAGSAVGDSAAGKLIFARRTNLLVLSAHRENHSERLILLLTNPDAVHAAGLVGELKFGCQVGDEAGAEAFGLVAHRLHQLWPLDAVAEAGVVLDLGCLLQQAAPLPAFDYERREVGAGCVKRRCVTGRAAADNDYVFDLGHALLHSGCG